MCEYYESIKNQNNKLKKECEWLIYESIENNYFDFIQLICDAKLWFLWIIDDRKHASLLQYFHNQCICDMKSVTNNNGNDDANMIDIMITKQRVAAIDFLVSNMQIFNSQWLYRVLCHRQRFYAMIKNPMFYQTINKILINDSTISNKGIEYSYSFLKKGSDSYFECFWDRRRSVNFGSGYGNLFEYAARLPSSNRFIDIYLSNPKTPLPKSYIILIALQPRTRIDYFCDFLYL